MYELVRGPLVWIAAIVFIGGSIWRITSLLLLARKDKVVYPTFDLHFGARSVAHWLVPFGTRNMRLRPVFTVVSFAFHICLLVTPLFIMGHAVLWKQSWGIRWWSLPPVVADVMTLVVIFGCLFFLVRRLVAPEVRNVTTWSDPVIVLIVMAPFVTGFLASYQVLPYHTMVTVHIITGALWLMAIPFTRLSHMLWFLLTRAYMGSEFGAVRHSRDW
jgi:nitrate reductase gamma subunit